MDSPLNELVIDYLRSLKKKGTNTVIVDDEARSILRAWTIAQRGAPRTGLHPASPARSPLPAPGNVAEHTAGADQNESSPGRLFREALRMDEQEMEQSNAAAQQEVVAIPALGGDTLEEKLLTLKRLATNWQPARDLGTLRDVMVFSTGDPHSPLMFVGEAPGYYEEKEREPFVGRAGEKFNAILKAMNLSRESVYITNVVKFRPRMEQQLTNNRAPYDKEIACCLPILLKEIELIRPRVIVTLGITAAKGILGNKGLPLAALRGSFHEFQGIPVRVTYHPSYLLRTELISERRKVWEDMLAVMERLDMPISPRQQRYFLPKPQ